MTGLNVYLAVRAIAVWALVAAVGLVSWAPASATGRPRTDGQSVSLLLWTINEERSLFHERMLQLDRKLCRIAAAHAIDMVEHNYFNHVSLSGLSPFDRLAASHYHFVYAGENLALDTDPVSASAALWRSDEHRRNLLTPQFAHIGIAAVPRNDGEVVIVEDFSD